MPVPRPSLFVLMALLGACGGRVEVEETLDPERARACLTGTCGDAGDCCPGYACEAGSCTPHLLDDRCWRAAFSAACDPRLDAQCAAGETCAAPRAIDVLCVAAERLAGPGEPCGDGVGCDDGLWCTIRGCRAACCSDAECAPGARCLMEHAQIGSFGACFPDAPTPD